MWGAAYEVAVEVVLEVLEGERVLQDVTGRCQRVTKRKVKETTHVSETARFAIGAAETAQAARRVAAAANFILIDVVGFGLVVEVVEMMEGRKERKFVEFIIKVGK